MEREREREREVYNGRVRERERERELFVLYNLSFCSFGCYKYFIKNLFCILVVFLFLFETFIINFLRE